MNSLPDFSSYTGADWKKLADLARQQRKLSGFYNENFRLVHEKEALLFRFPKTNEEQMDPRPFHEMDIYGLLEGAELPLPELVYVAPDRSFQVEEFIQGALIDEIYPPGQKVSDSVIRQVADFYGKVSRLEIDPTDYMAADWPRKGPPLTFFEKLLEYAWMIYRDHQETHGPMYKFLEIPENPFTPFLIRASGLTKRPWKLMHSDLHRANMIEQEDGRLVVIDWELALYGDLLYCIAAHLHRCRYFPEEKEKVALAIYEKLPEEFKPNFMRDLEFYLDYEALKSVIGDTVRFPNLLKYKKVPQITMHEFSVFYADNLNRISKLLGTKTTKPEKAMEWFAEWAI